MITNRVSVLKKAGCMAVLAAVLLVSESAAENETRAWLAWGLYTDTYGIPKVLAECKIKTTESYIVENWRLDPVFEKFEGLNLVILSDVPARILGPSQQYRLLRFVKSGGGLIILGGLYGYGYGGMSGSFISEAVPIEITGTFDLLKLSGTERVLTADGKNLGSCQWVHNVKVASGAQVVSTVAGHPFAVTGRYGKGRVVAVLGTVLGEPKEPFWMTTQWHDELTGLIKWASGISNTGESDKP